MILWLALDPETRRVTAQAREFRDGDFPPGLRGAGWPRAQINAGNGVLDRILDGSMEGHEVDASHRGWWNAAQTKGKPQWPLLPDGS